MSEASSSTLPPSLFEPLAGCFAGVAQDAVFYPLDTMRSRLDVGVLRPHDVHVSSQFADQGPLRAFTSVVREALSGKEGWRGLFGGYRVQLAMSGPCNAIYFSAYRETRRRLGTEADGVSVAWKDVVAGTVAELLAGLLWTPLDVVKERLQVKSQVLAEDGRRPSSVTARAVLREVVAERGVGGLWRGYWCVGSWSSLGVRESCLPIAFVYLGLTTHLTVPLRAGIAVWGPFSGLFFAFNELFKGWATGQSGASELSFASELACGVGAGAIAASFTQPLDAIKVRLQTGVNAGPSPETSLRVLRHVLASEGAAGLFRATLARALWLGPGCGFSVAAFQWATRKLEGV